MRKELPKDEWQCGGIFDIVPTTGRHQVDHLEGRVLLRDEQCVAVDVALAQQSVGQALWRDP